MNDNKDETKTQALFNTKQAAKFLGVSVRTLKYWQKSGKLVPEIKCANGQRGGRGKCAKYTEEQLKSVQNGANQSDETVQFDSQTGQLEGISSGDEIVMCSEPRALVPVSTDGRKALIPSGIKVKKTNSCVEYVDEESRELVQNSKYTQPVTYYSPKDKVSYAIWNRKLKLNHNYPIVTVFKSEYFGCLINLDYQQIFESEDVITGAEFSDFDRSVYDALVTLYVSQNMIFTSEQIWRIISKNPEAKITETELLKIAKSMFHIGNFWLSILTDHELQSEAWEEKKTNNGKSFKGEKQYYVNLELMYGARLLEFRFLSVRAVKYTEIIDGEKVMKSKLVPDKWQLLTEPILYQYASKKAQIAAISLELFGFGEKKSKKLVIKNVNHTSDLTNFLIREIDTMKKTTKSRNPYSATILLERIYELDGINEVQKTGNNINVKKSYTRKKLEKILADFIEKKMISGYKFHKRVIGKSLVFYSVEILF